MVQKIAKSEIKPIYSLLVLAGVAIAIAASSALSVLAGTGKLLFAFAAGAALGLGWSAYIGLCNWQSSKDQAEDLMSKILLIMAILDAEEPAAKSSDAIIPEVIPSQKSWGALQSEVAIRELLDAVRVLSPYVMAGTICRCCGVDTEDQEHSDDCDFAIAQEIYREKGSTRSGWSQFVKEAQNQEAK